MHELAGTDDGIDRANIPAIGAADAKCLADHCESGLFRRDLGKRDRITAEEIGEPLHGFVPARRAQVDGCVILDDCKGIRAATGIAALRTLCLRQQLVDLLNQWIAIRRQPAGGITQCQTCQQRDDCYR
jgi:hypothetical protein